jgi:hypothetical protein
MILIFKRILNSFFFYLFNKYWIEAIIIFRAIFKGHDEDVLKSHCIHVYKFVIILNFCFNNLSHTLGTIVDKPIFIFFTMLQLTT